VPQRTRIKICGITRAEDARAAIDAGVDAIGFVFVTASKRYIQPVDAAKIALKLPPFVTKVGLFLDAPMTVVEEVLSLMPDCVPQFHGTETPEYCDSFRRPYLKAISIADGVPKTSELDAFERAAAFLFDSHVGGELGGTGKTFDWNVLEPLQHKNVILAGGINESNISEAIRQVAPYAVDLSTGVELDKGIKDPTLIQKLVGAIRLADAEHPRDAVKIEAMRNDPS
jgi:phosphoribosylanthranilate isomerase